MAKNKKFDRKHFFINRKLQGKYMVTFLVPMLVLLAFMVITIYIATQSLFTTAATMVKDDLQNKIMSQFQDELKPSVDSYRNLSQDINMYLRNFTKESKYRQAVITTLLIIFGIGLLFVIIQLVLLTIFFSHKLAGPIYRFEIVCHNIIEGKYTDKIILRKGDEMQNLAELLNEVIQKTHKRFLQLKNAENDEHRQQIFKSIEL